MFPAAAGLLKSEKGHSNQVFVNGVRDVFEVVVHSMNGKKCYVGKHTGNVSIQLDNLLDGMYVATIRYGQNQYETKVLL